MSLPCVVEMAVKTPVGATSKNRLQTPWRLAGCPVVVPSRRQLLTRPLSPKMDWNARLRRKQCGYWHYGPLTAPSWLSRAAPVVVYEPAQPTHTFWPLLPVRFGTVHARQKISPHDRQCFRRRTKVNDFPHSELEQLSLSSSLIHTIALPPLPPVLP